MCLSYVRSHAEACFATGHKIADALAHINLFPSILQLKSAGSSGDRAQCQRNRHAGSWLWH